MYRVYVIENFEKRRYIGLSEKVEHRLEDHNSGVSKWTKYRGPWVLLWTSEAMSLTEARKLENKLKRQKGGSGFYAITGISPGS
jgi:putative endonuclease